MKIVSKSESATVEAGRKLGRRLEEPRIILLCGELGAGKTAFTRGLATGLGLADASLVHRRAVMIAAIAKRIRAAFSLTMIVT